MSEAIEIGLDFEKLIDLHCSKWSKSQIMEAWQEIESGAEVFSSYEEARRQCPSAWREVETRWGRAGYRQIRIPLADGRTIVRHTVWASEPRSFSKSVFYFS